MPISTDSFSLEAYLGPAWPQALAQLPVEPQAAATADAAWRQLGMLLYAPDPKGRINLNNGMVSPTSLPVQAAMAHWARQSSYLPPAELYGEGIARVQGVYPRLAQHLGVGEGTLAFTRNTTEAMATVLFGHPWQAGDELLLTDFDYPSTEAQAQQLATRYGVQVRHARLPLPTTNPARLVDAFEEALSPRTRWVVFPAMLHWTGQLLPIAELTKAAQAAGARVLLDAAHACFQLPMDLAGLGVDAAATSLHKWLGGPHGTGLLYLKEDLQSLLHPLFPYRCEADAAPIEAFRWVGTHHHWAFMALHTALDVYEALGPARRTARLQQLAQRVAQAAAAQGWQVLTPMQPGQHGALVLLAMEDPEAKQALLEEAGIWTTAIIHPKLKGLRITPHFYHSHQQIAESVYRIAKETKQARP